jgi:hypothetical protein
MTEKQARPLILLSLPESHRDRGVRWRLPPARLRAENDLAVHDRQIHRDSRGEAGHFEQFEIVARIL